MIKNGLLGCIAIMVVVLGVTLPDHPPGSRERVPKSQKVAHSSHCAGCHGFDETKMALVDHDGHDVNIYDDWLISMMGMAARDPFWRATLTHETHLFPNAKNKIESTCLKCHAPLGSIQRHLDGLPYSYADMLGDSLGLDGVSCSSCHQQPMQNLGKGHSGNFTIDTNRIFFGHYPNPFKGPMQIYVGFEPEFSDHIYDGGVCAGCHTLITETLDEAGVPTGNSFVEQATYHEWLNSVYPNQGKECQTCHLPFIEDEVVIATDFLALEGRQPFGLHQFFGANTAMLKLMHDHKDELALPSGSSEAAWTETIENNRVSLKNAAEVTIREAYAIHDTLYAFIRVKNKAGHKLPSGYPSRLAWLQLVLINEVNEDTIYKNGFLDTNGNITGRDFPVELHHEVSRSSGDVQIYELAMGDSHGQLTTRLNAAAQPLKDNRLLPLGFSKSHTTYDTVAIFGNANEDADYNVNSQLGIDLIEYRIPLNGAKGFGKLVTSLHYQALPSRWMQDIFTNDTLEQVAQFKSMYQGYAIFDEVIGEHELIDIPLSGDAVTHINSDLNFSIRPNPVSGNLIYLQFDPGFVFSNLTYQITDYTGHEVISGRMDKIIALGDNLPGGLYYLLVLDHHQIIGLKAFVKQ